MKRRWPLSRGLYPRLLTTVLAVALLPLLLITVLGFTTARETLYRQTFDDLTAAAEARGRPHQPLLPGAQAGHLNPRQQSPGGRVDRPAGTDLSRFRHRLA